MFIAGRGIGSLNEGTAVAWCNRLYFLIEIRIKQDLCTHSRRKHNNSLNILCIYLYFNTFSQIQKFELYFVNSI